MLKRRSLLFASMSTAAGFFIIAMGGFMGFYTVTPWLLVAFAVITAVQGYIQYYLSIIWRCSKETETQP